MKAKTFQEFNEKFFKGKKELKWFSTKGVMKLNENLNVEIDLIYLNCRDDYNAYKIKIINKISGEVTSHIFKFDDYLNTRIDTRKDYNSDGFKIIEHCGTDWYIAVPDEKEIKNMVKQIFEYINKYK